MDKTRCKMTIDNFYSKVGQVEQKELIEFIDHNQTELTIKIINQFVKTNVNYVKNDKILSLLKFHNFDFSNEPVLCTFSYKDEIYLFQSHLTSTKVDYGIEVPTDIYQIQRRNDFRVSMPIGLMHECSINYARGIVKNVKTEIRDLSMGGCQLSVASFDIEMTAGDDFDISLKLDRFEFARLNLTAKHVKHIPEQDTLLIGASFHNLDVENLNEMRSLLMFLDRKSRGKEK